MAGAYNSGENIRRPTLPYRTSIGVRQAVLSINCPICPSVFLLGTGRHSPGVRTLNRLSFQAIPSQDRYRSQPCCNCLTCQQSLHFFSSGTFVLAGHTRCTSRRSFSFLNPEPDRARRNTPCYQPSPVSLLSSPWRVQPYSVDIIRERVQPFIRGARNSILPCKVRTRTKNSPRAAACAELVYQTYFNSLLAPEYAMYNYIPMCSIFWAT